MAAGPASAPAFPGRVLKPGSADAKNVLAVQRRLNQIGCGPVQEDGAFGAETMEAVSLFQARSVDFQNRPLVIDGSVGPMTWAALFNSDVIPSSAPAAGTLASKVLLTAGAEVGVMEEPPGSNRGPKVNQYLAAVGLDARTGSFPWCAAFIYWCFRESSVALGVPNPAIRTAGALDLWNQAGARGLHRITNMEATETPSLVRPGMVFVLGTGPGHGHVGFVESVAGVVLTTIEGNTNDGGSREGVGVFRRTGRRISGINQGFVDYTG